MDRLQEVARQVATATPAKVAEWTGIKQRRLARFVNAPTTITFVELEKIKAALADHSVT